jgi:hypothetical protein
VPDLVNVHDSGSVVHGVQNPVIALANPVSSLAGELLAPVGARLRLEPLDSPCYLFQVPARKLVELIPGALLQGDAIGVRHA